MHFTKIDRMILVFLTGLLAVNPVVSAMVLEPGIGAGLEYTNNAALTRNNEQEDWIAAGNISAHLSEHEGPLIVDATGGLAYQNYLDNTFGNKHYFNLAANSTWEMIRNRLDWQIQDYLEQTPVNSLDASTPDNIESTNVFSFGPNIKLPLSGRHQLTINPLFQDYHYSDSDTDNRQYGVKANWLFQMYPTMGVGLGGGVTQVKYNDSNINPDYTISTLEGGISGTRIRSQYSIRLGGTVINRDREEDQSGPTGKLDWLYKLTARSNARVYLASELTDSSSVYYNSQVDPGTGNSSNVQTSGDILRSNIARLGYERHGSSLLANIWGEYRDENYKIAPDDRKVTEVATELNYGISPLVTTGFYGNYNRTKATNGDRTDNNYLIGGNVSYSLSRKLRTVFDIHYRTKDSSMASAEYSEFAAIIGLVYGYNISGRQVTDSLFPDFNSNW